MKDQKKRATIFSELEKFAFFGFPDFDDEQRETYFSFEEQEWQLILKCRSLHTRIYCALQIGYFKAKKFFFQFTLKNAPKADINFLLLKYFQNETLNKFKITKHEYYMQRLAICHLFDYQSWSNSFLFKLNNRALQSAKRDVTPNFIAHELLVLLENEKIIRPRHTTLQDVVTKVLVKERTRITSCLKLLLTEQLNRN